MNSNMSKADSVVRIIIAAILTTLYLKDVIGGLIGFILLMIAIVLAITGVFGYCPLYAIFGFKTNTKDNRF
jgi:hypothetical protein